MSQLEAEVGKLPGVEHLLTTVGADVRRQVDRGSVLVDLVPMDQRQHSQSELMLMARDRLKKFRDLTIAVQLPSLIQGSGPVQDIQFYLQGPDLDLLNKYATQIKDRLAQVPGVTDLDTSYEPGKPEVRVLINRDRAADLNVSVFSIATALRTLVGGDEQVTTYREGDDRYDVMLRVKKEFRDSAQALERLYVPSSTLGNVPVSNVASLEEAAGPTQIERYNRQRQILLSANLVEGQALSNVLPILDETVANLRMSPQYQTGLVGRSREFGRASASYIIAFLLSIIFMYMVIAAQFDSFIDPVTILISLPLSVPFALLSLLATGENFSIIYSSLGILVLFGIVKKNAILQLDHIKSLRAHEKLPRLDAILKGCEDRLRPILMTTASLVAGMIPLALGGGPGSGSRRTVAIVVIGGQSLCLLLTLLVTPVTYSIFDDVRQWAGWRKLALFPERSAVALRRAWGSIGGLFCVALLVAALTAPALAQQRVGVGVLSRDMTLQQAIEMALSKNLDIQIEKTNTATARQALKASKGVFDPAFRWLPGIQSRTTPTSSVLVGSDGKLTERFHTENFLFGQKLPWAGSSLNLSFDNNRQSTTNPFSSLNPFISSNLIVNFTQPLWRNRRIDRDRAEISIRRKQLDISDTEFELRVIGVISGVQQAYWDLVAARQDERVQADSVKLAEEQLARNQRMIQAGTLAPVELAGSEAELERRRDTWYSSIDTITRAENALKLLIADTREAQIWNEQIVPADVRSLEPPATDDLRQLVAEALKRRPEIQLIGLNRQSNDIRRELNSDLVRPRVDLTASYGNTGLAGALSSTENPFSAANQVSFERLNELSVRAGLSPLPPPSFGSIPNSLVGGYGSTLSNLFSGRFQTFQAGLAFDLTFRNRAAEANLAQSLIADRRLRLTQTQLEQAIDAEVRNTLQALQTAKQRIAAAEASERAARERLDSEVRLFQSGESTNFLVLTRQNEYADSRRRTVVANLDFNRAVARLEQALGSTLEAHNITLK
jgi:HAE1 family hydrophobic/amphiphilic exporter-1